MAQRTNPMDNYLCEWQFKDILRNIDGRISFINEVSGNLGLGDDDIERLKSQYVAMRTTITELQDVIIEKCKGMRYEL